MPGSLPRWKAELIGGLLLAALGGYFVLAGLKLPPPDEPGVPGPGTIPTALGAVIAFCGLATAVAALRASDRSAFDLGGRKQAVAILGLVLGAAFFESAGFVLSTFLFLLGGFTLLGGAGWHRAAPAAALVSMALWFTFTRLLGVGLPYGLIGEILFR